MGTTSSNSQARKNLDLETGGNTRTSDRFERAPTRTQGTAALQNSAGGLETKSDQGRFRRTKQPSRQAAVLSTGWQTARLSLGAGPRRTAVTRLPGKNLSGPATPRVAQANERRRLVRPRPGVEPRMQGRNEKQPFRAPPSVSKAANNDDGGGPQNTSIPPALSKRSLRVKDTRRERGSRGGIATQRPSPCEGVPRKRFAPLGRVTTSPGGGTIKAAMFPEEHCWQRPCTVQN